MRHNAKPVTVKKILNTGLEFTNKRGLQNYKSLPYYFAPFLFKKWYDGSKHYKYDTQTAITGTEHFTAMVWKAVKYIGIAVKEVNNIVHIYIIFEPTPNGVKLFSSNVQRRKYLLHS
uniref:SCP domain-containing protein n=1 Tax=Strongyloides venezuelensis TaxID=75913 RepID=A0A0K0G221_STRVS